MTNKIIIWIIFLGILIIIFIGIFRPVRTKKVMEVIAKEKLMDEPFCLFTDKYKKNYKGIEGPLVSDRKKRIVYTWYIVLEWGDTAKVSAYVYKNFLNEFLGFFRKKNPPDVTANHQWNYIYIGDGNGISKFADILPNTYNDKPTNILNFSLNYDQNKINDSIEFCVKPERILYYLKKGYFFLDEKNKNYAIVDFYEPIAQIVSKYKNLTVSTMSAKIYVNDSSEVLILPIYAPIDYINKN